MLIEIYYFYNTGLLIKGGGGQLCSLRAVCNPLEINKALN